MNITEILVIGFDGDSEVFTTNITGHRARTVFTLASVDDKSIVESLHETTADALGPILRVLEDLGIVRRPDPAYAAK